MATLSTSLLYRHGMATAAHTAISATTSHEWSRVVWNSAAASALLPPPSLGTRRAVDKNSGAAVANCASPTTATKEAKIGPSALSRKTTKTASAVLKNASSVRCAARSVRYSPSEI